MKANLPADPKMYCLRSPMTATEVLELQVHVAKRIAAGLFPIPDWCAAEIMPNGLIEVSLNGR